MWICCTCDETFDNYDMENESYQAKGIEDGRCPKCGESTLEESSDEMWEDE